MSLPNTAPPAVQGVGTDGSLGATDSPRVQTDRGSIHGQEIVRRRHIDYTEHQIRWRFLLDSYEGGERYRNAVYGQDRRGFPIRNLLRHRREYPDPQQYPNDFSAFAGGIGALNPGTPMVGGGAGPFPGQLGADPAATAMDDDYELRRARTPVPEFVAEAVEIHLGKVYGQEVMRDLPDDLRDWCRDVDGKGTVFDDWMRETVAPLLMVVGNLDIGFDRPPKPKDAVMRSRADEIEAGLDACLAYVIMPENMVWWKIDRAGRYTECLVREYTDPSDRTDIDSKGNVIDPEGKSKESDDWRRQYVRYRHWTAKESVLYSSEGNEVLETTPHKYGRVPIVRLIDQKKHRCPTCAKSRYDAIAQYQREYYNRDSELILSDIIQAHAILSGPEDYCKADNTISVGPMNILPMKKNPENGVYAHWEYISPPKDPAESLRLNKGDLVDNKDRRAALTKPAGTNASSAGGKAGVVGQSGIAKTLDNQNGHAILGGIAKMLARAERIICEYALLVLRMRVPTPDELAAIKITYPATFDLMSGDEIAGGLAKLQNTAQRSGAMPSLESAAMKKQARQILPGQSQDDYAAYDDEIDQHVQRRAEDMTARREGITDETDAFAGEGTEKSAGGVDPSGESASTAVGNYIPASVQ